MPQDFDPDAWMAKQKKPATKSEPSTGGGFDPDAFMAKEAESQRPRKPATVLPQDRQEFGRRPMSLDESLTQSARFNRGRPAPRNAYGLPTTELDTALEEHARRQKRAEFERKPITEQIKERATDALTRGGGQVSRMARQTIGAGMGVARGINSGDFSPVDLPEWRKGEEGRFRTLEQRRQSRPSSFAADTAEGILEALPAASIAALATIATGGSLPAAVATGGGMAAAGADWNDPRRAAVQTALGAVAPVVGGKVGQSIGGAAARVLTRPVAQGAARAGGEVAGGAAGNVIGSGAEQLAFEGKLNPRELARQGIIGGALSAPGAISAGRRRGAITEPLPETQRSQSAQPAVALRQPEASSTVTPRVEPQSTPQSAFGLNLPGMGQGMGDAVRRAWRDSVQSRGRLPGAEKGSLIDQIFEMAVSRGNPRDVATLDKAMQLFEQGPQAARQQFDQVFPAVAVRQPAPVISPPRTQQPPEVGRTTAEIPRVPTAPTQRIPTAPEPVYPDAPATQEMPEIRARIAAEEAPTRELPARGLGIEPTNRITEGAGDELQRYPRAREGQPVEMPTRPQTAEFPEVFTPGRRVSQEFQIPGGLKKAESFISREDARQGHFEQFDDAELVQEIQRMEDVQNQATRGRSKLSGEELEANRFDLKTAVGMQKERRRLQQQIGVEPGERIPVRAPARVARKIQHSTLGEVTESANQKGVPKGKMRVDVEGGGESVIQNPRTKGNRQAAFVKAEDVAKGGAKEPWQMTREEFGVPPAPEIPEVHKYPRTERIARERPQDLTEGAKALLEQTKRESAARQKAVRAYKIHVEKSNEHLRAVKDALDAGKPVPTGVLKEYPYFERKAPPTINTEAPNIVQGMAKLARTPSSPVEITKLRAEFPGMSKADFDGQMAKLNEEGRIALQRHDHPASLKEAERANMVQIGNDYFTAATFRERPGQVMGMGLGGAQNLFTRQNLKRAGAEAVDLINLPRALMASADLSAPLRQGAILTLPPSQWGRASKAGVRMFQALSTKQFEKISEQINTHPDAETGRKAKLYISTDKTEGLRKSEEDFLSRWADKIPIVKQSQQAYQTYLDSLRMDTFAKYKRVIDKSKGLSPEQRDSAYKAAAEWINTATGRGTLGKTFESAMPLLSKVAFAPRYTASRVQILNPVTYAKNASTAAGRAVLKQQMTDVVQFAGVVSATLAIAKAAGAEVGTDPEDSDFLKIKVGNVRYDTLAGLQQVMRLFYRTGKDVGLAVVDKKSEKGEGALEVAGKFARSKLAPVPSFFVDALSRKDFIGRDFEVGRGVKERMIPLMWKDFYDAYQREGIGGAAKLTPGAFGLGVQDFAKKPGVLTQKNDAYTGELKRLGVKPSESARRLENEPEDLFKGRADKIESWRDQYGAQLVQHPMYQRLSDEQKKAAVESLHQRISQQANEKRPNLRAFRPDAIARGVREGERSRRRTDRDKIYVAPR